METSDNVVLDTHWHNLTGIEINDETLQRYLGFIYRATLPDGRIYIGRKQFWTPRGRGKRGTRSGVQWVETDWRTYTSSSTTIKAEQRSSIHFGMLAIFTSKSAIRYAEAAAIIWSRSYEDPTRGINGNFAGSRGKIKLEGTDAQQLNHLRGLCNV